MPNEKKKSKLLIWLCAAAAVVIIAAVALAISGKNKSGGGSSLDGVSITGTVASLEGTELDGLKIVKAGRYAGLFVEDGSDETVSDVFALIVENTSDSMLQYAEITVALGSESYVFKLSTIPAGARAQVLEADKKALPEDISGATASVGMKADFPAEPSMYEDIFEVTAENYAIRVKNISANDISGDIYVYYKSKVGDLYMGGITYRVRVGGLAAGESENSYAAHYVDADSEIMFVTYG